MKPVSKSREPNHKSNQNGPGDYYLDASHTATLGSGPTADSESRIFILPSPGGLLGRDAFKASAADFLISSLVVSCCWIQVI